MRILLAGLLLGSVTGFAQIQFEQKSDRVIVKINGSEFTQMRFGKDVNKPYLYPLRTASGKIVTRGFPEDPKPGEDTVGYHQRGTWIGHELVSGVDYFEVDPRGYKGRPTGTLIFQDLTAATGGDHEGVVALVDDWVHPNGTVILRERRAYKFYDDPKDSRTVDVEFRLTAKQKIELTDHKDCVLGLRLGMAFEERFKGVVRNFAGVEGAAAVNGRRSPWLTWEGMLDGEAVGITIMDHPDNYGFPTRWRVTPRAVSFASSFGNRAFYPRDKVPPPTVKDTGVTLQPGDEMVFRFRILIHPVTVDHHAVWKQFALAPPTNLTSEPLPLPAK